MEDVEILRLRTEVLTLHRMRNSEDIPRIFKETKLKWRKELEKKKARRKRYEEINNKINKKI